MQAPEEKGQQLEPGLHSPEEEFYYFLRSCSSDFEEAIRLVDEATQQEPKIAFYLLRYAVIAYFRPFTKAKTKFPHQQWDKSYANFLSLRSGHVPDSLREFHEELKTYRDSAFAHSDLAIRNPRLHYWPGGQWEFPVMISPVDKKPLHIHQDKIRKLCELGHAVVIAQALKMEDGFRAQYAQ